MNNAVVQILRNGGIAELTRAERTDAQLLDLFARHRDQDAFALLVQRHGPMVLGVCNRVLRNPADADDAFQAAFLVLARKAATIGTRELLAQWLYGVAFNTARRLKRTILRRSIREKPLAEIVEPSSWDESGKHREPLVVLDEELSRLPERYRLPILLCDLQGMTRKEAARLLACPEGTVAGRLARARTLLTSRLLNRGVTPAFSILGAVLSEQLAVALSPELMGGIVRAACAAGVKNRVAMGLISPRVANTTEGVLKAMFLQNLKTAAMVLLLCGLAITSVAGMYFATAQTEPDMPLAAWQDDRAEAKKQTPTTTGKKIVTVVPLMKLKGKETAEKLNNLFSESVTVASVRDENVLLVYATEAATEDVYKVLEILGEERGKYAALHKHVQEKRVESLPVRTEFHRMQEVPWNEVLDWYARTSGLKAGYPEKLHIAGSFNFTPAHGKTFTLAEITDIINEGLMRQHYLLIRKARSFTVVPADEKIDPTLAVETKLDALKDRGDTELVMVAIPLPPKKRASELAPELQTLLSQFGTITAMGSGNSLVIIDIAASLRRVVPVISDSGREDPAPKKNPANEKKHTFYMNQSPWDIVFLRYSEISGLSSSFTTKPAGKLTLPNREMTLAEITDFINEGLSQQKLLLIRRGITFSIVPMDEKLDPTQLWSNLNDLEERGKTEMTQVIIPLTNLKAAETSTEIKKLLGPMGAVSELKFSNSLVVRDSAGNLQHIVKLLQQVMDDANAGKNPPGR